MLVTNVSLRPPRAGIAADIAEAIEATDATATGQVVFATLVDDPASVGDRVDAYLGEIMVEAASAAAVVNAGFAYVVTIAETVTAASAQDATSIAGVSYATWDPATAANATLSNGDLTAVNTTTGTANQGVRVAAALAKTAGKFYFENTFQVLGSTSLGIAIATTASTYANMANNATTGVEMYAGSGNIWANGSNTGISLGARSANDVVGIAVDLDNRRIWFKKVSGTPGNWNNSGTANPATNVGGITVPAGTMAPVCTLSTNTLGCTVTVNFGASAFVGAVPSGFTSGWV